MRTRTRTALPTDVPTPLACLGDCSGDGLLTIDELILGVRIALGQEPVSSCAALDVNGAGVVSISDLVSAVNQALAGCG